MGAGDDGGPALEARAVTKRYGRGAVALRDVTLRVPQGSITALVGPNAAGKSTLIKTWVGFERPSRGEVRVDGIDPWRKRGEALARVSNVPQQPALYRGLSVAEHLDWCASVRRGFDTTSANGYLDALGISPDARPSTLSGGQQAQVHLAIALGAQARVLLLDEPLASLDPLARGEFLAVVRAAVRERGATVLLSSHIVTDIEQVCDRLIVLGVGRVLLDDTIASAIAGHCVLGGESAEPTVPDGLVGSFADEAGLILTLVRRPAMGTDPASGPRATLDQVVKGYLAAGRQRGDVARPGADR